MSVAPDTDDSRAELALRRSDLLDRLEALGALERRLKLAFVPAGILGGGLAGLSHAVLGEPMFTLAMIANTAFLFFAIQGTRAKNRRDREEIVGELEELDG